MLGFLVGALVATIAFKYGFDPDKTYQEKVIEAREERNKVPVQYVEIKGKKGVVAVHTGMPKDSVKMLVGKPDKVDMNTIGSVVYENWGYVISKRYGYGISDLDFRFENGLVTSVDQN